MTTLSTHDTKRGEDVRARIGVLSEYAAEWSELVDALRVVSEGVNRFADAEHAGVLLITHYTRILRYIHPQFVHVFVDGRIVESGGPELADELEENGYVRFTKAVAESQATA